MAVSMKPARGNSDAPWMVIHTPDSVLADPPARAVSAGDRTRYSTCPGLAWVPGDRQLVTSCYLGRYLDIYAVDADRRDARHLRRLDNDAGMQLGRAADVTISADGRTVAVGNSGDRLNVYRMDDSGAQGMDSHPSALLGEHDKQRMHGVAFSADAGVLAYATIDDDDRLVLYRCRPQPEGDRSFTYAQDVPNPCPELKPKSIAFSHDNRHMAVCYSMRSAREVPHLGRIVVFAFDAQAGRVETSPPVHDRAGRRSRRGVTGRDGVRP